mmetsp:Transcript_3667/g.6599  ORF Transcript_3667/g.6599 Transcript_3667/m.6599 type:complete len:203 (-) Transcript_3667:5158-5766(-)
MTQSSYINPRATGSIAFAPIMLSLKSMKTNLSLHLSIISVTNPPPCGPMRQLRAVKRRKDVQTSMAVANCKQQGSSKYMSLIATSIKVSLFEIPPSIGSTCKAFKFSVEKLTRRNVLLAFKPRRVATVALMGSPAIFEATPMGLLEISRFVKVQLGIVIAFIRDSTFVGPKPFCERFKVINFMDFLYLEGKVISTTESSSSS